MLEKKEVQQGLAHKNNFTSFPGQHTVLSTVVGSRVHELELIHAHKEIFAEYQKVVYGHQKINIIPLALKKEADTISKAIFAHYIQKYANEGLTIENAVLWSNYKLTKTRIRDKENKLNTWKVTASTAKIDCKSHIRDGKYRPAYICALHELMHVEETPKGILKKDFKKFDTIDEVLTVTRTLILMDEVYKQVHGISLEHEVDYENNFTLFGKQIPQGQLANFYRQLETTYSSLAETLVSEESLNFLGYNPLLLQSLSLSQESEKNSDFHSQLITRHAWYDDRKMRSHSFFDLLGHESLSSEQAPKLPKKSKKEIVSCGLVRSDYCVGVEDLLYPTIPSHSPSFFTQPFPELSFFDEKEKTPTMKFGRTSTDEVD